MRRLLASSLFAAGLTISLAWPGAQAQTLPPRTPAQTGQPVPGPAGAGVNLPGIGPAPVSADALARVVARLDAMEQEARDLRGQNERLRFDLEKAQAQAKLAEQALDDLTLRVRKLEAGSIPSPEAGAAATPETRDSAAGMAAAPPAQTPVTMSAPTQLTSSASPDPRTTVLGTMPASALPGDAGQAYRAAHNMLLAGDFVGAGAAFEQFLAVHGDSANSPDARFWLGESLSAQGAWGQAIESYLAILEKTPDHARAPDAMLKLGLAAKRLGDNPKACAAFKAIPLRYPGANSFLLNRARDEAAGLKCG